MFKDWPSFYQSLYQDNFIARNLVHSILIFLVFLICRRILLKGIYRSNNLSIEQKQRWVVNLKSFVSLLFMIVIVIVWAREIKSIMFSIAAVIATILVATKEYVLCIAGTLYRVSTNPFSIGDRIEIDDVRGDVIDQDFLSTKILEVGPGHLTHQYTGRSIVIPNSYFLIKNIINESYADEYILHVFIVPLSVHAQWKSAREILLSAAIEVCGVHMDHARSYMKRLAEIKNFDPPSVEPRVSLKIANHEQIDLIVRIAVPARSKGKIEQSILQKFVEQFDFGNQV